MNKIYLSLILILLSTGITLAQGCGPSCPVCSGAGSSGGSLLSQRSMMFSTLSIPTADEETTVANTRYGLLDWLDAGIGYAFKTEKVLWNIRTQPLVEKKGGWQPGIILGTGSVQTGGSDQSIYLQLLKSFDVGESVDISLSTGAATLLPDLEDYYGQAGITASFKEKYAAFANYDGESYHEGISWIPVDWFTLSFMMVETEYPAFSIVLRR